MATEEELLAQCERGRWFLKHRAKGEKPHRRFVYVEGSMLCWCTRESRKGKTGTMCASEGIGLTVTIGAGTTVLAAKKRLEHCNRLFSIVGSTRTLDLEAESEAERHLWVRALSTFAKRWAQGTTSTVLPSIATSGGDEHVAHVVRDLGVGIGAALGIDGGVADVAAAPSGAPLLLASAHTSEFGAAVHFPRLAATMLVLTGDMAGRWQQWDLELRDGELSSAGRGVLPLRHIDGLGLVHDAEGSDGGGRGPERFGAELRLRLRLGAVGASRRDEASAPAEANRGGERVRAATGSRVPDMQLRAPLATATLWHKWLSRSMTLVADLDASQSTALPPPVHNPQLMPLRRESLEVELNSLFEGAFAACAGDACTAVSSLDPLMEACVARLLSAAATLPPRRDLFEYLADGMHARLCNVYQALLVRYDLDRTYLDTVGQQPPAHEGPRELLEPSLMLALIGWAKRYEERMAAVGAGSGRQLLSAEASESLISAYLHAARQLTRQWAANIVFVEQQAMMSKDEDVGARRHGVGARAADGRARGGTAAAAAAAASLSEGIITIPGEGAQQLWFTELHMDLFRIVHEHVELGIGTGIETVLFNVLLSSADFLVDVQNEMLRKVGTPQRALGFVYLLALINNCRRCIELWEQVLATCTSERSPLSDELARNLHLGYVVDGFVNLGHRAMQLMARRVGCAHARSGHGAHGARTSARPGCTHPCTCPQDPPARACHLAFVEQHGATPPDVSVHVHKHQCTFTPTCTCICRCSSSSSYPSGRSSQGGGTSPPRWPLWSTTSSASPAMASPAITPPARVPFASSSSSALTRCYLSSRQARAPLHVPCARATWRARPCTATHSHAQPRTAMHTQACTPMHTHAHPCTPMHSPTQPRVCARSRPGSSVHAGDVRDDLGGSRRFRRPHRPPLRVRTLRFQPAEGGARSASRHASAARRSLWPPACCPERAARG